MRMAVINMVLKEMVGRQLPMSSAHEHDRR